MNSYRGGDIENGLLATVARHGVNPRKHLPENNDFEIDDDYNINQYSSVPSARPQILYARDSKETRNMIPKNRSLVN